MSTVYEPWTDTEYATSYESEVDDALIADSLYNTDDDSRPAFVRPRPTRGRRAKPKAETRKKRTERKAAEAKATREKLAEEGLAATLAMPQRKPLFKARPGAIGINWPITGWLVFLHLGALAAPFFFSWQGLVLAVVLHWVTGGLGVCLGYHRLFTHGSFSTYRPVRWLLGLLGVLSGEGAVGDWVANHRKHHALSDKEGDPHSPHDGAFWSHALWIVPQMTQQDYESHTHRWAPDVARDRVLMWIGRLQLPLHFVFGIGLLAIGWACGGWVLGASLLAWGLFARLIFVLHSTWLVNSASHMWGYTNYEAGDDSRNNWLVALLTYGEGWHNNHHAYPRMANHGHRWWEFDLTFRTIRLMQRLGLAWNVVDYKHKHHSQKQAA